MDMNHPHYIGELVLGRHFTPAELAYLDAEQRRIAARVQINPVDNQFEVSDDWAMRRREIKELDGYGFG